MRAPYLQVTGVLLSLLKCIRGNQSTISLVVFLVSVSSSLNKETDSVEVSLYFAIIIYTRKRLRGTQTEEAIGPKG